MPDTKAVDVYLFGELLLYIILQEPPGPATSLSTGNRHSDVPRLEEQCRSFPIDHLSRVLGGDTHPVAQLVEWCLQSEPGKRPSASEVLKELSEGWVEVECRSEQVLKWGLMVSMKLLGSQFQVGGVNIYY